MSARRVTSLDADVEDARLCVSPQTARREWQGLDQAYEAANLLIGRELPRIAQLEMRGVATAVSALMQKQHPVAQGLGQTGKAGSGEDVEINSQEMGAFRLYPLDPVPLFYPHCLRKSVMPWSSTWSTDHA